MKKRIGILKEHGLKINDIINVIATMQPLKGAFDFLDWLRTNTQIIIVSDTFVQFAGPLMEKLKYPTLFCNTLIIGSDGTVTGYRLRQEDGKKKTVDALKSLNFNVIAMGDSYNDITMLKAAEIAILYGPPDNVKEEYTEFPVTRTYDELKQTIKEIIDAQPESSLQSQ